jgi:hypothetical protein
VDAEEVVFIPYRFENTILATQKVRTFGIFENVAFIPCCSRFHPRLAVLDSSVDSSPALDAGVAK